ncbi:MAG: heavy-metal-associated domain-containing protein [Chloroflexi bacterium]|nr:heavy-metal-associated domain-containing protein [Chloroflexota bacterium]MDA8236865.1 heavy-metal-associated domain-containing protein [Chloroflexota bacterium]
MTPEPLPVVETIRFPVEGMTCVSCVNRIERAVRKVEGVRRVRVDLGHETATVSREPALVSDAALAAAVEGAGYRADLAAAVPVAPGEAPDGARGWLARLLGR